MSNNGLERTGIEYVINDATVARSAANIINAHNNIEQAQNRMANNAQQLAQKTDSFDSAVGASSRSVRLLTGELVSLTGVGGPASGIISGLLQATGALSIALVAVAGAVALVKAAVDAANESLDRQAKAAAVASSSFGDYLAKREALARATPLSEGSFAQMADDIERVVAQLAAAAGASEKFQKLASETFLRASLGVTPGVADVILGLTKKQGDLALSEYAAGIAARIQAKDIEATIPKLLAQGASIDEVRLKYIQLIQLQQSVGNLGATAGIDALARRDLANYNAIQSRERSSQVRGLDFLSPRATKFGEDILAAQQQFQDDSASAYTDYQSRMAVIAEQGERARLRLNENYGRQIADLQENEHQAELDAFTNLTESIAAAEENANEQRAKNAQDFADRRAQIEQSYQDQIKQITQSYEEAVFSAAGRNDAHALIEAQRNRDKGVKAADEQRKRDADAAKVAYDKQQKELNDALKKQERKLHEEYDKRIRQLEDALKKQEKKAGDQHDRDLKDLNDSQTDQQKAEKKHYDARTAAIAKSFTDRKAQLINGLEAEQGITDKYARAIIASMKGILRPDEIAALIKEFDAQLKAKIDISVTPFTTERKSSKPPPPPPDPATGQCPPGYHTDNDGQCVPDEAVTSRIAGPLPVRPARLPQFIPDIYQARVPLPESSGVMLANFLQRQVPFNMPGAQRYASAGVNAGAPAKIQVIIENRLNNKMLESTVRTITDSQITVTMRDVKNLL